MIRTKALVAAIGLLVVAGGVGILSGGGNMSPVARSKAVPFPTFTLPRFAAGAPQFTTADLGRDVVVVNFFSSWCGPCRAEHPLLMKLKDATPIIGINYMDDHEKAGELLKKLGNPYRDIAVDKKGEMEAVLGVDSVPRTLVVAGGRIVYAHQGRLKQAEIDAHLMPILKYYQKQARFHAT